MTSVRETADLLARGRDQVVVAAITPTGIDIAGDADAVYEIGSVTKVFTARVLARQVVRGSLRLDDTVGRLLPHGTELAPGSWLQALLGVGQPSTGPATG